MKRRILLVDDEVAVLLTMKAVLEISGFEVETAASAREGKARLRTHQYQMVITDMRMESDVAGHEVVQAARVASYHPAVALLTAFPVDDGDWGEFGSPKLLLKPMHTRVLLQQIEKLFQTHEQKLARLAANGDIGAVQPTRPSAASVAAKKSTKPVAKKIAPAKALAGKPATKASPKKTAPPATKAVKKAVKKAITK